MRYKKKIEVLICHAIRMIFQSMRAKDEIERCYRVQRRAKFENRSEKIFTRKFHDIFSYGISITGNRINIHYIRNFYSSN